MNVFSKTLVITTLAVSLFALTEVTSASEVWLDMNLGSKHMGDNPSGQPWNERNYGLGATINGYTVGFYKNSYFKTSFYAGVTIGTKAIAVGKARIRLGASLGAVSGYFYPITPVAIPNLSVEVLNTKITVGIMPAKIPVITLAISKRL